MLNASVYDCKALPAAEAVSEGAPEDRPVVTKALAFKDSAAIISRSKAIEALVADTEPNEAKIVLAATLVLPDKVIAPEPFTVKEVVAIPPKA
ncbi:hypothetical protein WOSG25_130410 [Weissella oryzae SG25]|uniref:Uncharacterized protein n=1 Tax=Weissella oryzae (strain DSM 25784 / JCM 18191 / LMG 30913 / SG25) TaxID=1329250 RepID=A0A069CW45_WEIOS|nr:hypothetical protein WOSG25_130410 [Weissella oryzae SG25]